MVWSFIYNKNVGIFEVKKIIEISTVKKERYLSIRVADFYCLAFIPQSTFQIDDRKSVVIN